MGNVVEFVLKLKDMMSGGMRGAASTAQSAMRTVDNSVMRTQRQVRNAATSITDMNRQLDGLRKTREVSIDTRQIRNANREMERLERRIDRQQNLGRSGSSGGGSSSGGSMLGSIVGGNLISAGITAAASGVKSMITQAATAEQSLVGLKTFLGAKGAQDAYANIQKDAAATPYTTGSLMSVNRALISTGMSAPAARKDTMNLANAIAGSGGGNDELQRMAVNMQQIRNQGKATAMDIRQFGMAGINIYQLLADATGKNISQVRDMDVSYDLLSKALEHAGQAGGLYAGAMQAQSQTMAGKWSTLVDNLEIGATKIGMAFEPIINRVLDMGIAFGSALPGMMSSIAPIVDIVGSALNGVVGLIPVVVSTLSPLFGLFREIPIGQFIKDIIGFVSVVADTVKPVIAGIMPALRSLLETGYSIAHHVFGALGGILKSVAPLLSSVAHVVGSLLAPVFRILGPIIERVVDIVGWLIDKLAWLLKPIFKVVEFVSDVVGGVLGAVTGAVEQHKTAIANSVGNAIGGTQMAERTSQAAQVQAKVYADSFTRNVLDHLKALGPGLSQADALASFKNAGIVSAEAFVSGFSNAVKGFNPGAAMNWASVRPKNLADNTGVGSKSYLIPSDKQLMGTDAKLKALPAIFEGYARSTGAQGLEIAYRTAMLEALKQDRSNNVTTSTLTGQVKSKSLAQQVTDLYNKTVLKMKNEVPVSDTGRAFSAGTSDLNDSSDKVNGGGVRAITINLGKFFDTITVNVKSLDEGIDATTDKLAEAFLRMMHSASAMQTN